MVLQDRELRQLQQAAPGRALEQGHLAVAAAPAEAAAPAAAVVAPAESAPCRAGMAAVSAPMPYQRKRSRREQLSAGGTCPHYRSPYPRITTVGWRRR